MAQIDWDKVELALRALPSGGFANLVQVFGHYRWWHGNAELKELAVRANRLDSSGEIHLRAFFASVGVSRSEEDGDEAKALAEFFWSVLPELTIAPRELISVLRHLQAEGVLEADLAWHGESLKAWASKTQERPTYFVKAALEGEGLFIPGLLFMLIAGADTDPATFLDDALRLSALSHNPDQDVAIFAIGHMVLKDPVEVSRAAVALQAILASVEASQDMKAAAYRSWLQLVARDEAVLGDHLGDVLDAAVAHLAPERLRAITVQMVTWRPNRPPQPFLDFAFRQLEGTTASETGTIQGIDHALYGLIEEGLGEPSAKLVAALLSRQECLSIKTFGAFTSAVRGHPEDLEALLLRWFTVGTPELCRAAAKLLGEGIDDTYRFSRCDLLQSFSIEEKVRLCHRVLGWCLHLPLATASLIVAIIQDVEPDRAKAFGDYLADPLLMNFPGSVHKYLKSEVEGLSEPGGNVVVKVLAAFDAYHAALETIKRIRELEPSDSERFMAQEQRNEDMADAEDHADPSPLLAIFPRVTVLYGNKTVFNVYGGANDTPKRSITPMTTFSVSCEFPRQESLDPVGQAFRQLRFRAEG